MSPHKPFTFEAGDINIRINYRKEHVVGKICSQALIQASPVWRKFLIPPWANEQSKVEIKEIDCSDDNGEALLILLNIAHLKFTAVPRHVSYDVLYQLAILIDEYQCIQLVVPWADSWMRNEMAESRLRGQEGWLFIAWVFGREHILEELSKMLVATARVNEKGELWRLDEKTPLPEPMSNGLIESIHKSRLHVIELLLKVPYDIIDRYEIKPYRGCSITNASSFEREICDAITYGSITVDLQRAALWPRQQPEDVLTNVEVLATKIRNMRLLTAPIPAVRFPGPVINHEHCVGINFHHLVLNILDGIMSPVL